MLLVLVTCLVKARTSFPQKPHCQFDIQGKTSTGKAHSLGMPRDLIRKHCVFNKRQDQPTAPQGKVFLLQWQGQFDGKHLPPVTGTSHSAGKIFFSVLKRRCWGGVVALLTHQIGLPCEVGAVSVKSVAHLDETENCAFFLLQVQVGRPLPGHWSVCLFRRAMGCATVSRRLGAWVLHAFAMAFPGDQSVRCLGEGNGSSSVAVLPFTWFRFAFLATALQKAQFLILLEVTHSVQYF